MNARKPAGEASRKITLVPSSANSDIVKMISVSALVFSGLISVTWGAGELKKDLGFPPSFQFGVASSAYQMEGAWNISDKGESIWDRFTHDKNNLQGENGDVACDSYHLWKRDVEMVQELGVNFYRFSISWTRILPKGFTNYVSKDGIKYYSDLIDALLEKGIEPIITIYHWDLPQRLQDLGGWTNPLIANWFAAYARVLYTQFADRVKTWITINEPCVICDLAYQYGILAPGIVSIEGSLLCSKHILLAHAKAWRIYNDEFRAKYQGRVAVTNLQMWFEPLSEEDKELAELAQQMLVGIYSFPIYSAVGGWPPALEKVYVDYSKKLGHTRSILPSLTKQEVDLIKGTYDFYALNYYTSRTIRRANASELLKPWPLGDAPQIDAILNVDPSWDPTARSTYPKHPEGLRKQLQWVKKEYGVMPTIITENGAGSNGKLEDEDRVLFIKEYIEQVMLAINVDGVNVTAYTAWSLMDCFEWMDGYKAKFGLYNVDFSSPERTRTPRASAVYYTSIIRNRSLDVPKNISVRHANTQSTAKTSNYIFIIGGILVVVAIVAAVVVLIKRQRAVKREYTGVQTQELVDKDYS